MSTRLNHASVFNPEPPEDDEDVLALFVNRDAEKDFALKQLLSVVAKPRRKVLVVRGLARVGKSHFLNWLCLQETVREEFGGIVRLAISQGTDAETLLRQALRDVYAELRARTTADYPDLLLPMQDLLQVYGPAIGGAQAQVKISVRRKVIESVQTTVGASAKLNLKLSGLIPTLAGIEVGAEGSAQLSQTQGNSKEAERSYEVTVQKFNALALADLLGLIHGMVRLRIPTWKTLLVIDDFDLLGRDNTGKLNPDPLLQILFDLAQNDGLYVLTTVREDTFANRVKSFLEVVQIKSISDKTHLREIYQRHVDHFHEGQGPFNDEFLQEAVASCDGRIGIFLEVLDRAFRSRTDGLDQLKFADYVGELWTEYAGRHPAGAKAIRTALEKENYDVSQEDAEALRNSVLWFCVLEDYSSSTSVIVKPYIAYYLKQVTK